MLAER
jgi:hypothetical protein